MLGLGDGVTEDGGVPLLFCRLTLHPLFFLIWFIMPVAPRKLFPDNSHGIDGVMFMEQNITCQCFLLCPSGCKFVDPNKRPPPPPPPPTQKLNGMPTFLIPMLCVLGTAFMFLFYLTILKRYRLNLISNRRRASSFPADGNRENFLDANHGPVVDHPLWHIRTVGLPQSVIDSIAVFKYMKGDGFLEGTDCSVCLSEFEVDETLRLLPKCNHAFHISCIDTWLRSHTNCPLCRAPIVCDATSVPRNLETSSLNPGQSSNIANPAGSGEEAGSDGLEQQNVETAEGGAGSVLITEGENPGSSLLSSTGKICERTNGVRVLSDLTDRHRLRISGELHSVRRSSSMDLYSTSRVYSDADAAKIQPVKEEDEGSSSIRVEPEVGKPDTRIDIAAVKQGNIHASIKRSRRSFSFGRSLQNMPILMKRSLSTSGKSSL